jgi:dipeptide/tripeptide permease
VASFLPFREPGRTLFDLSLARTTRLAGSVRFRPACFRTVEDLDLAAQRTFLGHPIGLYVLFFTEMWERFSYYGMRGLLMLYMVNHFRWSQKDASEIYKIYVSFVYVTPILGGYLADRLLGNRVAVIIGAVLMAIGHFLMAFEETFIFYSALVFLIFGNGFFKPNMSTQVGRLYPPGDGRRDGAYTIFYMGINLGAFLAPLVCGWMAANMQGEYHAGFTMAGFGMVVGLVIYLLGQPFIKEIDPETHLKTADAPVLATKTQDSPKPAARQLALTESEAAAAPSAIPVTNSASSGLLLILAGLCFMGGGWWLVSDFANLARIWSDLVMLPIAGTCFLLLMYVCSQVVGGVRDRVLVILALGIFVIFFWGAFEQAGNVLNIWADKNTNRFLTKEQPLEVPKLEQADEEEGDDERPVKKQSLGERLSSIFKLKKARPDADQEEKTINKSWLDSVANPIPTAWFQSINALAIFLIAPLFAWGWIWLDKRGMQPGIPLKMTFGLLLMSASVGVMVVAAKQEDKLSTLAFSESSIPAGIRVAADRTLIHDPLVVEGESNDADSTYKAAPARAEHHDGPFHAGRLKLNAARDRLELMGVLPDTERDRIIQATAPADFAQAVKRLKTDSEAFDTDEKDRPARVAIDMPTLPAGFDLKYSGIKPGYIEIKDGKIIARQKLTDREVKALLTAAGNPEFRDAIWKLYQESIVFRVSPWWLFWSYILATLGELCLSPVGLSMVSKLAPAKYATMLMGVWMLTTSFGNFAAGRAGEAWGTVPPVTFFLYLAVVVAAASLVLYMLCRKLEQAMHGVK